MTFYEKVKDLCETKGISITTLAIELGFSKSAPTTWKASDGLPRASTIKKVADYFGLSVTEIKMDIELPIDFDCIDTSSFNQEIWQHLLEKNGNDEKKAIRAYLEFEKANMRDAYSVGGNNITNNQHNNISHNHAPVTVINGTERKLTEQELALLEIFSKIDVVKQARLLSFASELEKEE